MCPRNSSQGDSRYLSEYCDRAAVHAALGRTQAALTVLEEGRARGQTWVCDLGTSWLYESLRTEPRFTDLLDTPEPTS